MLYINYSQSLDRLSYGKPDSVLNYRANTVVKPI